MPNASWIFYPIIVQGRVGDGEVNSRVLVKRIVPKYSTRGLVAIASDHIVGQGRVGDRHV